MDISCRKRTGVKPEIWRRWALQIRALLSLRNSSISGGILKFCENVDKEFSGVEPCPICYSVIMHIVDRSLPKVSCKVCQNKFHSACIYKWFNNSQKAHVLSVDLFSDVKRTHEDKKNYEPEIYIQYLSGRFAVNLR